MAEIDKELLDILACPIGKADLQLEGDFLHPDHRLDYRW